MWQNLSHKVGGGRIVEVNSKMDFVNNGIINYDKIWLGNKFELWIYSRKFGTGSKLGLGLLLTQWLILFCLNLACFVLLICAIKK